MEPVIIATKADKLKPSQTEKAIRVIRTVLKVKEETPVIAFSSLKRTGRDEVWNLIRAAGGNGR